LRCSIKNIVLPDAPKPIRVNHNPRLIGEGARIHEIGEVIPTFNDEKARREIAAKARARASGKAEKRHDMIARLARDGLSNAEIAELTGYKPDSVRRLIVKMRKEGVDIPERTRGRKKKCN